MLAGSAVRTLAAREHARDFFSYLCELLGLFAAWRTYRVLLRAGLYAVLVPAACVADSLSVALGDGGNQRAAERALDPAWLDQARKPHKRPPRAAGRVWTDETLADWPEDDFRIFVGDLGNEAFLVIAPDRLGDIGAAGCRAFLALELKRTAHGCSN